jgi:Flp pilus assembly pilin Flp
LGAGVLDKLLLLAVKVIRDEDGQDLLEYGTLLGFVTLASIVLITSLGTDIAGLWVSVVSAITSSLGKVT